MRYNILLTFLFVLLTFSCNSDAEILIPEPEVILTENVLVYNSEKIHNNLTLLVKNASLTSLLVDKMGNTVYEWSFDTKLGNDFELLSNGKSIGMFKRTDPVISFGGYGGVVKIFDENGTESWSYDYTNGNDIAHHDVEMLPSGNVIFLVWEEISAFEAQAAGVDFNSNVYAETLIEVNPNTNQVEWKWRSWDHIVQEHDSNALNYDPIANNPQRININYNINSNGDFMHANGLSYDTAKDVVYISVNYFSEVWAIDHSTTISEASGSSGGNYNKGGDLLYRFGNPSTYNNSAGTRIFYNNHFPNLLKNGVPGAGNMLVYSNLGPDGLEQSSVYEIMLPEPFSLLPNINNEPTIVWSFTDEDLFFSKISGADRLLNGNTLICEGDFGMWEVTTDGEVVWKYESDERVWRAYGYEQGGSELEYIID
tara:strand:- start:2362 stop:3636 length:1275 start_codon:yes stop_codon:yes gene_type:complete